MLRVDLGFQKRGLILKLQRDKKMTMEIYNMMIHLWILQVQKDLLIMTKRKSF